MKKPKTTTLEITKAQQRVLIAIVDAIQFGDDARIAAQRAEERNNDVEPVGEGSEEEHIIWTNIMELFDKIRFA
jgi:anti-sigma regulatory factor (Ser/Thr protein kinase)